MPRLKPEERLSTVKDDKLLSALLQGASNKTAAVSAGYSEATVYRRLNDPKFHRRYVDARRAIQDQTLTAVIGAGPRAILTLLTLMNPANEQGVPNAGHVRLQAAKTVAELGIGTLARIEVDATVTLDIEEAVDTLKARLAQYRTTGIIQPEAIEATSTEAS